MSIEQETGLEAAARAGGLSTSVSITQIITYAVNGLLGIAGIIFFLLLLSGGIQWMTSGGDEKKIGDARHRIASAAIGLAIVFTAFAITMFVVNFLGMKMDPWSGTPQPGPEVDWYDWG